MQYIQNIYTMAKETVHATISVWPFKTLFTIPFLTVFHFLFGMNSERILLMVTILVTFDFITGVIASHKSGLSIESRRSLKSVLKLVMYGVLASAAHLTETIIPGTTFINEATIAFLALTELISIIENVGRMGYAVPQRLLNQLGEWRDGDLLNRRGGTPTRRDEIVIPKK